MPVVQTESRNLFLGLPLHGQLQDKLEHLHTFADSLLCLHLSCHGPPSTGGANADDALNEVPGEYTSLALKTAADLEREFTKYGELLQLGG